MLDEKRKGRITASSVGAILGCAPYATRADVMRRMVREYHGSPSEFEGNIATMYGTQNESNAIFDFELFTGESVEPYGFCIHPDIDWLGATPDGIVDDFILEVKCPYGLRENKTPEGFKSLELQPHYYAQIQIQLFCSGKKLAYFFQWSVYANTLEIVRFSPEWITENLPKIENFWLEYLQEIKNPDFYLCDSIDAPEAVAAYQEAKAHVALAESALERAKGALLKIADGRKCNIGGVLCYPVERAGSISYASALKDLAPNADLEAYRGAPASFWVVK